jgi:hypothetical protein
MPAMAGMHINMGIPPHIMVMGMPVAIIFIIISQRSLSISIDMPSGGVILHIIPSLVISQLILHIMGMPMPCIMPGIIMGMLIMGMPIPDIIMGMPMPDIIMGIPMPGIIMGMPIMGIPMPCIMPGIIMGMPIMGIIGAALLMPVVEVMGDII